MIGLVAKRHPGDGWIIFSELANASGYYAKRRADAVALGVWASTKYEAHLYEFKASREDLKKEIKDPEKMQAVGKFCHYRWLAVEDEKLIDGLAIPDVWGIVAPTTRGGQRVFKVIRKAPKLKAEPFSVQFAVAAIRNIRAGYPDPVKYREMEEELNKLKHGPPPTEEEIAQGRTKFDLEQKLTSLTARIQKFEEASGVNLHDDWHFGRIGEAVKFALEHRDLLGDDFLRKSVHNASRVAEELEAAAREAAAKAVELRKLASGGGLTHREGCSTKQWGSIIRCRCGVDPLSDVEKKLVADERERAGGEGAPATAAGGDDDGRGGLDRGDAGAPVEDAGLQLRDQRDALPHGEQAAEGPG